MSKKSSSCYPKKPMITQSVIHPDAAGIDLAAEVHYVAVPADRDPQPVRSFGTTTDQLCALADWLQQCDREGTKGSACYMLANGLELPLLICIGNM